MKRHKMIGIRMTDEELRCLKTQVKRSGLNQQKYVLECLFGKPIFFEFTQWQEIRGELKRVGNNINQLIKLSWQSGSVNEVSRLSQELLEELKIWQSLRSSIQRAK